MSRYTLIAICSLVATSQAQFIRTNIGGTNGWVASSSAWVVGSTNVAPAISAGTFFAVNSLTRTSVGTQTSETYPEGGPFPISMRLQVFSDNSAQLAKEFLWFGMWRYSNPSGVPVNLGWITSFGSPGQTNVAYPAGFTNGPPPVPFDHEGSKQLPLWAAGGYITLIDPDTGEIIFQGQIGADGVLNYAFNGNGEVLAYYNDTLMGKLDLSTGQAAWPGEQNGTVGVLQTGVGMTLGPAAFGGGQVIATNGYGNAAVQYEVRYLSGGANVNLSSGTVVRSGSITSGSGGLTGGSGGLLQNLGLPGGAIYSVTILAPNYTYTNMGDGVQGYVITGTNQVTIITNVPAGSSGSGFYAGTLPGASNSVTTGTNTVSVTPGGVSNSVATNTVYVTNSSSGGTNGFEGPATVAVQTFEFGEADYGESNVIARATNLLGLVQQGLGNLSEGMDNFNGAAAALGGIQPPGASGGCTLQMGDFTLNIGGGVFASVRSVAGYLVALIAVFGAARMMWDSLSA